METMSRWNSINAKLPRHTYFKCVAFCSDRTRVRSWNVFWQQPNASLANSRERRQPVLPNTIMIILCLIYKPRGMDLKYKECIAACLTSLIRSYTLQDALIHCRNGNYPLQRSCHHRNDDCFPPEPSTPYCSDCCGTSSLWLDFPGFLWGWAQHVHSEVVENMFLYIYLQGHRLVLQSSSQSTWYFQARSLFMHTISKIFQDIM